MDTKPQITEEENTQTVSENIQPESAPKNEHEEEHGHANYLFAFKVIAVLVAIILIIVILKASGVPVAIRDWFKDRTAESVITSLPLFFG